MTLQKRSCPDSNRGYSDVDQLIRTECDDRYTTEPNAFNIHFSIFLYVITKSERIQLCLFADLAVGRRNN